MNVLSFSLFSHYARYLRKYGCYFTTVRCLDLMSNYYRFKYFQILYKKLENINTSTALIYLITHTPLPSFKTEESKRRISTFIFTHIGAPKLLRKTNATRDECKFSSTTTKLGRKHFTCFTLAFLSFQIRAR